MGQPHYEWTSFAAAKWLTRGVENVETAMARVGSGPRIQVFEREAGEKKEFGKTPP